MKVEQRFSLDEICKHAKELLGVYPEVIYGAMVLCEKKEKYSIKEVKEAINLFMKREVM